MAAQIDGSIGNDPSDGSLDDPVIARVCAYSAFARRTLADNPSLRGALARMLNTPADGALAQDRFAPSGTLLAEWLRRQRKTMMLHTMVRDFAGAPFSEIVGAVTRFAAFAVPTAQHFTRVPYEKRHGSPLGELITVGMGKLGGEELNVSSDIDLIYVFPEDGETAHRQARQRISNAAFFAKQAAATTALLDEMTADGFVFRVDTRLRPYGEEGPLAVSIDFLEQYFFEQARFWERLAWLRSASMSGAREDRERLRALVRPFVFRRYLDYDAYTGLRELHGKIRAEGFRSGGEANIKLGRGGIRELEFFVQVQQLVRGGRDPSLQLRTTIPAINALERAGLFKPKQAQGLREAYPFLRRVEHFLQYENDEQTQTLPKLPTAQFALSHALGYADWSAFLEHLNAVRQFVATQFDNLSQSAEPTAHPSVEPAVTTDPFSQWPDADERAEAARYFAALSSSQRFATLPAQSVARVHALLAKLPAACAVTEHRLASLKNWGQLIEAICGRSAYLALLSEHAQLLAAVTRVLSASAWAAGYLRDHPILLDELLDVGSRDARFDPVSAQSELASALAHMPDTEAKLDALRRFQQTALFRILLQDLDGNLSVETLADDLSALADVCVDVTLRELWTQIAPNDAFPALAVIAYGRWGGKELGYGSDLDLVFIVGDDVRFDRCAKLAQRLQSWLTTLTTAGQLYEIDTRLRPDGESGMLLSPISVFREYQLTKAWRWEHQALSRARFAAGDATLGAAFESVRREVLVAPKDARQLRTDIAEMRARMRSEKVNKSGGFDVKNDSGGMVDIEFIVQTLVLLHANEYPFLIENKGNIALLHFAGETGLLPHDQAEALADGYRAFRGFQHHARLQGVAQAIAPLEMFAKSRQAVQAVWQRIVG